MVTTVSQSPPKCNIKITNSIFFFFFFFCPKQHTINASGSKLYMNIKKNKFCICQKFYYFHHNIIINIIIQSKCTSRRTLQFLFHGICLQNLFPVPICLTGVVVCNLDNLATTWQNQQSDCAHNDDSVQPGYPPRLIWVFSGRTYHFVGFVVRRLVLQSKSPFRLWSCAGW